MPFLKSLPDDAVIIDVFKTFPDIAKPLIEFHEQLMRGPSPLSPGERELIAAYVSGLNTCTYCQGVHQATAEEFGVPRELLSDLLKSVNRSDVDDKMKPVLSYVRKLTQNPSAINQGDANSVFAVGWSEDALRDAVLVCGLFNLMNRLVEGLGVQADADYFQQASKRISQHGYAGLAKLLETKDD